jgi:hypothetical protein
MHSASDALRKLSIVQRKCLFNDESIEQLPVYSYNACNLVCRANAALRLCGCRPYYYPFMNGTSCPPAGLLCLAINNWPKSAGTCGCSKTCVEIIYTQNSLKKINWWELRDISIKFRWLLMMLQGCRRRHSVHAEVVIPLWDYTSKATFATRRSFQLRGFNCLFRGSRRALPRL